MPTLKVRERMKLKGRVRFRVYEGDHTIRDETVENTITTAWLNQIRDGHKGDVSDITVRELHWGDDNTTPAAGQTALGNELGLKQVTQRTATAPGVLLVTTYVAPGEAVDQLEEWALFGGAGAAVMVSRVLWSHDKLVSQSVQVDWQYTFSEVP